MAEQKIEFRRVRDFGENINDTFLFIRQNLKSLLTTFFAICGILMLAQAILSGIYQSNSLSGLENLFRGRGVSERPVSEIFSTGYFLMLIGIWITFLAMQVSLAAYVKFYVENDGIKPSIEDVWRIFRRYFFKIWMYSIPIILLTLIGFVFCLAPGFWLYVVWAPFVFVVMIEDQNFGGAFNRCFDIVKNNFWSSFGVYAVAFLIYNFSAGIIGLSAGAIAGVVAYLSTKNISTTIGIVTSFCNIFSYTFYIIYLISVAFQYFNLVERRDGTGVLQRINTIGTINNDLTNTEEEY